MILAAVLVLGLAVAVGLALAARAMRADRDGARRVPLAGVAHGLLGLIGLGLLLLALDGPPRGLKTGTGGFGPAAAALFAAAAAAGLLLPVLARRRVRGLGVAIALHGSIAITGFTLLLAWASLG